MSDPTMTNPNEPKKYLSTSNNQRWDLVVHCFWGKDRNRILNGKYFNTF